MVKKETHISMSKSVTPYWETVLTLSCQSLVGQVFMFTFKVPVKTYSD